MNVLQDYLKIKRTQMLTQIINSADDRQHSHIFYEIFYICSGSIRHKVNNEEMQTLSTGSICFLRPGDTHIFFRKKDNDCAHRDILISKELFARTCDFLSPTLSEKIHKAKQPYIFMLSQSEYYNLENDFQNFSSVALNTPNDDLLSTENYLACKLLHILLEHMQGENKSDSPQWIKELIVTLNDKNNFHKTLKEIVSEYHYNPSYLSRSFSKYMGTTMANYYILARLNYSVKLLQFTQKNIGEIAIEAGFYTITYFNRCFKKAFGFSPNTYRKNVIKYTTTFPRISD